MPGARDDKTMRWVRFGGLGTVLVIGWLFVAWQNHFHVTPPLVFAMLGYLAVVLTTYNLWRTGAAAVAPNDEDDGDAAWGRPTGARGELDREKRTLLKAIKEAEFDLAMGKLSKADADQMIHTYRARAIEVMKELDQLEQGAAGSVRERILREVKARAAVAGKLEAVKEAVAEPAKKGKKGKAAAKDAPAPASAAGAEAAAAPATDDAAPAASEQEPVPPTAAHDETDETKNAAAVPPASATAVATEASS